MRRAGGTDESQVAGNAALGGTGLMAVRVLTPMELTTDVRVREVDTSSPCATFCDAPHRVADGDAAMPWRVSYRIGASSRTERFADEAAAIRGHAQIVADLIDMGTRPSSSS